MLKRKIQSAAVVSALSVAGLVGTATPSFAASAADICGSGYSVIESHAIPNHSSVTAYLLYNSGSGRNCAVTLRSSSGTAQTMVAWLEVMGGSRVTDSGSYTYYAGPVSLQAAGKCVRYGGTYTDDSYTSSWGHCS